MHISTFFINVKLHYLLHRHSLTFMYKNRVQWYYLVYFLDTFYMYIYLLDLKIYFFPLLSHGKHMGCTSLYIWDEQKAYDTAVFEY